MVSNVFDNAIHSVANEQNIYKLGGLNKVLPLSYIFILIGSLSLMGWPFYTGYYSKEYIIHKYNIILNNI